MDLLSYFKMEGGKEMQMNSSLTSEAFLSEITQA